MQPLYVLSTNELVIGVFDDLTKLKNEIKFDKRGRTGWLSLKGPTYNNPYCPPMDFDNFEKIIEDKIINSKLKRACIYLVDEERCPSDGESLRNDCHEKLEEYKIQKVLLNNDITPLYALDGEKYREAEKNIQQLIGEN